MKKLNQTSFRKLTLDHETLRYLSSTELEHVAGGTVHNANALISLYPDTSLLPGIGHEVHYEI